MPVAQALYLLPPFFAHMMQSTQGHWLRAQAQQCIDPFTQQSRFNPVVIWATAPANKLPAIGKPMLAPRPGVLELDRATNSWH